MIKQALLAMTFWLSTAPVSVDPLEDLVPDPIDIELKEAPILDVLSLVGDISGIEVVPDACVQGTVTFKLQGASVRSLLETLGRILLLEYRRDADGALLVGCQRSGGETIALDFEVVDVSVEHVVKILAKTSGQTLETRGCEGQSVDLKVENGSVESVLSMLATRLGATIESHDDGLVLACDA